MINNYEPATMEELIANNKIFKDSPYPGKVYLEYADLESVEKQTLKVMQRTKTKK